LDNLHPFDEWEKITEQSQKDFREQCLKDTSLLFQVFSTPSGKQLMERWKGVLINQPTAHAGDDLLTIGINEGYKNFIRTILNAVKLHEESQ
jgi:hypothetical protein